MEITKLIKSDIKLVLITCLFSGFFNSSAVIANIKINENLVFKGLSVELLNLFCFCYLSINVSATGSESTHS